MEQNTTIAAISTAPGPGAIAIVRLSGPNALTIAQKSWHKPLNPTPRHATLGYITDTTGQPIDQVILTYYPGPKSFTGEDMIEISCHGSPYIQNQILSTLIDNGASPAGPGEFSMRAVINGQLDLTQAEAIADIIAANSKAAADIALRQMKGEISTHLDQLTRQLTHLAALIELELDFSEEDVEFASRQHLAQTATQTLQHIDRLIESFHAGNAIKQGIPVAITGAPNAGKSTLLNTLLQDQRAIVSDIPGTTRDTIEETLSIPPYALRLIDTAGLRQTTDPIEQAGIDRTHTAIQKAAILITIIDTTTPLSTPAPLPSPETTIPHIILLNKTDLPQASPTAWQQHLATQYPEAKIIPVTLLSTEARPEILTELQTQAARLQAQAGQTIITNQRHRAALQEARAPLARVIEALADPAIPLDMLTQDLRATTTALASITAPITTPAILTTIFSHFCIGK